jgi:hypothetical protein
MCGSRTAVLGRLIVCCTVLHQDLVVPSSCYPLPLPSSTSTKHQTPNLGSSIVMDAIISRVLANLRLPLRLGQRREDHLLMNSSSFVSGSWVKSKFPNLAWVVERLWTPITMEHHIHDDDPMYEKVLRYLAAYRRPWTGF